MLMRDTLIRTGRKVRIGPGAGAMRVVMIAGSNIALCVLFGGGYNKATSGSGSDTETIIGELPLIGELLWRRWPFRLPWG
jgi:hypothetical protein